MGTAFVSCPSSVEYTNPKADWSYYGYGQYIQVTDKHRLTNYIIGLICCSGYSVKRKYDNANKVK